LSHSSSYHRVSRRRSGNIKRMRTDAAHSRREFLQACSVLALCGCARIGANVRLARDALGDPEPREWQAVLRAFTRACVAFDHPLFPASLNQGDVDRAVLEHFPLAEDSFVALRRGLAVFDDTALFGERLGPLVDDERSLGASDVALDTAVAHDARLFAASNVGGRFVDRSLNEQRRYVRLWGQSAFTQRRRFYRGAKTIVMVSTYSARPAWEAIGYDGPLLGR
jgi:hypothetical protein